MARADPLAQAQPTDPRVLDAYMKGEVLRNQWSPESLAAAIEFFQKALDIEPGFARAYAGLVGTHTQSALHSASPTQATRHLRLAKEAAVKAVTLDDTLAEAHSGLGWIRMHEWDWAGAQEEMERALELDPNSVEALSVHAHLLVFMGRFDKGIASQKRVIQLSPGTSFHIMRLSYYFYLAGLYRDSIEQANRVQEEFPNEENRWEWTADSYAKIGRYPEAVALCDGSPHTGAPASLRCARALEQSGQPEKADTLRNALLEREKERNTRPTRMAMIHAALDDSDSAMDWLNEAYQERSIALHELKVFPEYDTLRVDPRFQDLMLRLDFPQ